MVQGQSQWLHGLGQFRFSGLVTDWVAEMLTSFYDVALTRIRAYMANDMA